MKQQYEPGTLFGALEEELRKAKEPLSHAELWEIPAVREHAQSASRVSDYLGVLWRRGHVLRLPAPKYDATARSRWMYVWKNKSPVVKPKVDTSQAFEFNEQVDSLLKRPNLEITQEGKCVIITMPHLTITIRQTDGERS